MPKFSIIVPVYNVEKYIGECVESVLNQSFDDWELILIDDGSSDNSSSLCDMYAENDERIKAFHQKNAGASAARNNGLDNAGGDYIIFLDSDDYYNNLDALHKINDKIMKKQCDIVMFGCTDHNMITGQSVVSRSGYDIDRLESSSYQSALHILLSSKLIPGGPNIFAAARRVIDDNSIRFKIGVQDEDYDYVLSVFLNSNSIGVLNVPFYSYLKGRENSVTASSNIKMIEGIAYTVEKWEPLALEINDEVLKKDVLNYIAYIYTTGFVVSGRMDKKMRKQSLAIMKKYRYILKYGYWKKTKITRFAVAVAGDTLFSLLAAIYFDKTHI